MVSAKTLLITNLNNHYRDPLFRLLHQTYGFEFLFYSDGGEPYWIGEVLPVSHLGTEYRRGVWLGRTRVVPGIIWDLVRSDHDVVVATAAGKFVLPLVWLMTRIRKRRLVLWTGVWLLPSLRFHRIMRPVLKWLFQDADAVIAYGSHVRRSLVSDGIEPRRIFEAPQAIDNSRFLAAVPAETIAQFRISLGAASNHVVILYVGRLVPSKGVETLLRSVAQLSPGSRPWVLVVTGSGPLEPLLLTIAERLGIADHVRFIGRRPNADLPLVYQASDIVVVPSEPSAEGAEPWGLVVNEAMASGVAVVASDVVGAAAHGLPLNGQTGIVFRATNVDELAQALKALAADDELRSRIAISGKEQVQLFTYESMVAGMLNAVSFARSQNSPYSEPTETSDQVLARRSETDRLR